MTQDIPNGESTLSDPLCLESNRVSHFRVMDLDLESFDTSREVQISQNLSLSPEINEKHHQTDKSSRSITPMSKH